ncbi:PXA domain-containing protein [Crassisporium funariophilum]|nr:PXA domain-containing protein [Crassisporium funariophilum]
MPPSLAKRLLFHASPNEPLPPLLSSKNVLPELTPELYDFIALALRAYVSPWWSKITRYDKDFLPHITRIVTTVVRSLDTRIQALDFASLAFHDAPVIITQHYRDYRNAAAKTSTAYAMGGAASLPFLFSRLQPHMAISSDGHLDPEYYRQIIDHVLKACLPPEDFEPESERIMIREIIVKVLLNDVLPKITQPWFIHKSILDLLGPPDEPTYISQPAVSPSSTSSFSLNTLIIIVLSALQSFSGMCLALIHSYKQALSTIKLVQQSPPRSPQPSFAVPSNTNPPVAFASPEKITREISVSAVSTTSSISSNPSNPVPSFSTSNYVIDPSHNQPHILPEDAHYAEAPLALFSEMISSHERFSSTIVITTLTMLATSITPFLDKLLPHLLFNFLSPGFVLNTTRTAKRTLFPNGYPGSPPIDPSPEEQAEMRARLVEWRGKGGVALLLPVLLGPDPSKTLGSALDPLSDAQCNLHLAVFLLDRVLVGLFPELGGPPS